MKYKTKKDDSMMSLLTEVEETVIYGGSGDSDTDDDQDPDEDENGLRIWLFCKRIWGDCKQYCG